MFVMALMYSHRSYKGYYFLGPISMYLYNKPMGVGPSHILEGGIGATLAAGEE